MLLKSKINLKQLNLKAEMHCIFIYKNIFFTYRRTKYKRNKEALHKVMWDHIQSQKPKLIGDRGSSTYKAQLMLVIN